jgi:hypothetical protein
MPDMNKRTVEVPSGDPAEPPRWAHGLMDYYFEREWPNAPKPKPVTAVGLHFSPKGKVAIYKRLPDSVWVRARDADGNPL